jgi:D-sedoheptulose 7-phosphate isomerase
VVNAIRVLALDVDGVLTDGSANNAEPTEGKRFSFQDLDAITRVKHAGVTVAIVTGEQGPSVDGIAARFGVERVVRGAKDKAAALDALANDLGVPLDAVCYIGDGDRDAPALSRVGLGLAPANATPSAKAAVDRVLTLPGGGGAVAEAVRLLLDLQSDATNLPAFERAIGAVVLESITAHQQLLVDSLPTLARIASIFTRAIRTRHRILFFGNGGSAADAQHVAAELVGRFAREREPWSAIALTTDTSILTGVSNDWQYAEVFARQVRAHGRPGDVAVGISTSGTSPNVLRGLDAARDIGAVTIGFTGAAAKSEVMRTRCDVCFSAPVESTPRIQELHILAWHAICGTVEQELATG